MKLVDRYAVMGNPVAHSKSPLIHARFAQDCAQALTYEALLVERDDFAAAVAGFFAAGGKGLNVTVPFKEEAFALADVLTEEARQAGAVNTLYQNAQGELCGHNSDGIGLVQDIRVNHNGTLAGKRVLILGAGGASRGILLPLLREAPEQVVVANRTLARAEQLVAAYPDHKVTASSFEALGGQQFDWVINATSASLQGELPPLPEQLLAVDAWCYDLMYAGEPTPFCRWAERHGAARALDGLGMLVEQAAESFRTWRGIRPDTQGLIASLRAQ